MPAAYLTTPCDVIKTRLQVEARKGDSEYTSLRQCAKTVYKEEGFKAFFKGGPARILRSSPQFGFTLAGYEVLQNLLPMPGTQKAEAPHMGVSSVSSGLQGQEGPLSYLRSRNALKIILDVDQNFGLLKGPGKEGWKNLPRIVGGGKA
jgi:solute carrier family 25 aspartate/glutamate transporter 12/13